MHRYGQFGELAMPFAGSGLSRINVLEHQDSAELNARSFIVAPRQLPVCRYLRIVLTPKQLIRINMPAIHAFLASTDRRLRRDNPAGRAGSGPEANRCLYRKQRLA